MRHSKMRRAYEESDRHRRFNPSYEDFRLFLQQNANREFVMDCSHRCVGAVYAGRELSETYMGPAWFQQLQKRINRGVWLGADILFELERIKAPVFEAHNSARDPAEARDQKSSPPPVEPKRPDRKKAQVEKSRKRPLLG